MELNGWTWSIAGIILTVMSGYLYLFVPKNGEKNMAMAFFFFVGIVFLIIGITKLFFKRIDDKSVMDSLKNQPQEQKIVTMPQIEAKQNRVDEAVSQMMQQQAVQQKPANMPVHAETAHKNMHHTNSFSQMYKYNGPVSNPNQGVHAQHPVSQHAQPSTHHAVQNTPEHGIKCRRCGNANPGHANYCHGCGNRLK